MIMNGTYARLTTTLSLCLACLANVSTARSAESPDERFVVVYSVITEADALKAAGDSQEALKKYRQAQAQLFELKRENPTWNSRIVNTRLSNLAERIAALSLPVIEPASTPSGTAHATTSQAAANDPVKLLSPGGEPKRELRFQVSAGTTQKLSMILKTTAQVQVGEAPAQSMKVPAMRTDFQTTVKSVAPDGEITYEFQLIGASVQEDAAAQPEAVAAMKASLAGLKDLSGNGTVTSRGVTRTFELKSVASSNPRLRQSTEEMKETFGSIITAFPEEAVGPGATWEVRTPIKSEGMTIQQTATYELVSIDGDQVVTRNTIVQSAANQKVQNPAVPSMKADVSQISGQGSGTTTLNLTKLLPTAGTATSNIEMNMVMNVGGRSQSMQRKMDLDIKLEEIK